MIWRRKRAALQRKYLKIHGYKERYSIMTEHLKMVNRICQEEGLELPSRIYLFQCLPKSDKMELVIQKAVELGAYAVIPVAAKRCVMKLDAKKEKNKLARWQQIAEAAAKIDAPFLGQGTIYPDILESIPLDGNPNGVIKSHHNVGGLPKNMKFKLVEPVERLFKDEVRAVGRMLGLPSELIDRHPFPGPSLGVRHVGPIERNTLAMLREADAIVTEELTKAGWYHKTWQTFAIFVPVKTVGIKNGQRSYDYVIAIRSINSVDAVTAQVVRLPWELLETMMERIVREVDGVNRVVYDITAKPPGTIEWE